MGDLSSEPSMEEILSSIKRIIAEDGDTTPARRPRPGRAAAVRHTDDEDEVLELSDRVPDEAPAPRAAAPAIEAATPPPPMPRAPAPEQPAAAIVSPAAAQATRGSLENLSRLLVKPEPQGDGTLEGLVRELLRPMLREWIDANLPGMVEAMVAKEISRITGEG